MPIVVQCASCKKKIKAAEKFLGKRVKCPGCQHVLQIPAAPVAAEPLAAEEIPISQSPAPAAPPPPAPATSAMDDLLSDEIPIRQESVTSPALGQPAGPCPSCGTEMPGGSVVCVNCGYDRRAQAKHPQEIGDKSSGKKRKRRGMFGGHSKQVMQLLRGCLFSFIGACVGALVWYLVARFTFTQWALISWGLGGLAGLGMAAGYGHEEMLGGICAAVIAFLGIIVAKLAIFFWILGPLLIALAGMGGDDAAMDDFPEDEVVAESEEFPGEGNEDEAAMDEADFEEVSDEEGPVAPLGEGGVAVLGMKLFFLCMFDFYDIVFVILACGTAFKLGSSGSGGDF